MKKENGITLISLVVTIIVLIILAGISINLILGQDGIINKAKEAKQNMEYAQIEEQEQLNYVYTQIETQINSPSTGNNEDIAKINDFKKAIADYIGEVVPNLKPEYTADTETFGESIKAIATEATKVDESTAATADNISQGKQAWVNGELITGNVISNNGYRIDITITCYFSGYNGYNTTDYTKGDGMKQTHTHSILINNLEDISYENLVLNSIYGGGHRNGNPTTGTPAAFYTIDSIRITQL